MDASDDGSVCPRCRTRQETEAARVFAFGVLCLIASLVALIRMEERPLRGRN
jgi:hypothetical protein